MYLAKEIFLCMYVCIETILLTTSFHKCIVYLLNPCQERANMLLFFLYGKIYQL